MSVVKQCELLGIHRSGFYFKPRGESGLNLRLMDSFIYPYLLKNRKATKPNQIWQTDITYITMRRGFMYAKGIPLGYDSHNRCI